MTTKKTIRGIPIKVYIDLLKIAKAEINNHSEYYICFALVTARDKLTARDNCRTMNTVYSAMEILNRWIMDMLDPCGDIEEWLSEKYGLPWTPDWSESYRKTRLRWINWMIKEIQR